MRWRQSFRSGWVGDATKRSVCMSEQKEQNKDPDKGDAGASGLAVWPNLKDPRLVLSLLEADQVVAAKAQSRFGRRPLSPGMRIVLWGLRIYVLLMFVVVVISVMQTLHGAH